MAQQHLRAEGSDLSWGCARGGLPGPVADDAAAASKAVLCAMHLKASGRSRVGEEGRRQNRGEEGSAWRERREEEGWGGRKACTHEWKKPRPSGARYSL